MRRGDGERSETERVWEEGGRKEIAGREKSERERASIERRKRRKRGREDEALHGRRERMVFLIDSS